MAVRAALAKPRVVVLGSGWGGFAVAKALQTSLFDVTLVSPRNHMLFTVGARADGVLLLFLVGDPPGPRAPTPCIGEGRRLPRAQGCRPWVGYVERVAVL